MTHLKVTLKHSTIGRPARQGACVKGLGLRKIGQVSRLENTPAVRGMVKKGYPSRGCRGSRRKVCEVRGISWLMNYPIRRSSLGIQWCWEP